MFLENQKGDMQSLGQKLAIPNLQIYKWLILYVEVQRTQIFATIC